MLSHYLPVVVMIGLVGIVAVALLVLARAFGPSRQTPQKQLPYESGNDPSSSPRIRFSVQFYRVALLFLVFDIEAAFFYPWAVLYRDLSCKGPLDGRVCHDGASPFGLMVMMIFLTILLLALLFVWRRRALEWD